MPLPLLALVTATQGPIAVSGAWARATPPGTDSAAIYFTVTDTGAADRLVGVAVPGAQEAMLHVTTHQGGMAGMSPTAELPVSPAAPLRLQPGGTHVMVMGLARPWHAGETIPITLTFAHAGQVRATVQVRPLGSTSQP